MLAGLDVGVLVLCFTVKTGGRICHAVGLIFASCACVRILFLRESREANLRMVLACFSVRASRVPAVLNSWINCSAFSRPYLSSIR